MPNGCANGFRTDAEALAEPGPWIAVALREEYDASQVDDNGSYR